MNLDQLEIIFKNQPQYHLKQAKQSIWHDLISDWQEATALPKALREELNKSCPLEIKTQLFPAKNGETIKALVMLADSLSIEAVLLFHKDGRRTVCVSSQVGCSLGCTFCATGQMKFKRNLTPIEIVEQVIVFARYLKKDQEHVSNVVFMGMGEPFLNYTNVMEAIKIINDKNKLNIGARHISISTVGVIEGIKKLSQEKLQINLAVSLHAPISHLREKIIPAEKQYPLTEIFKVVDNYIKATHRRVMFEYLLIDGLNDSDSSALALAKLMKKPLYFVNLIAYNPTGLFRPSSPQKIKRFKNILMRERVKVVERHRFGREIRGACGQLFVK